LLKLGAIPIINENDTVSTDEILEIGDNDTLSAIVSCLAHADLLVILSDIDGLYDADPRANENAKLVAEVHGVTSEIYAMAGGAGSALGTGGMTTKLNAAKMVNAEGIDMVIMNGSDPKMLYDVIDGKNVGTKFCCK
ncbi:MAG: glutamate 5-kinase, partial [Oscillospiraceae bacterium]